ncbi:MAG: methyltransferase domain-containing protein, partial [Nitrospinota bacterium]
MSGCCNSPRQPDPKVLENPETIKAAVKERYTQVALLSGSCCGEESQRRSSRVREYGYDLSLLGENLPSSVVESFAGCGNPLAIDTLQEGEVVLDLGSGAGLDCFLAAKKVGEKGKVIGLDMTPAMLEKARANQQKLGITNVEFRQGEMEAMPIPDQSIDVIISNCVINLSPDKDAVFREAFRVLKPGGRLMISDLVLRGELPPEMRNLEAWTSCIGGAIDGDLYLAKIRQAGFTRVEILSETPY